MLQTESETGARSRKVRRPHARAGQVRAGVIAILAVLAVGWLAWRMNTVNTGPNASGSGGDERVAWRTSFVDAVTEAKASDKRLLLEFTSPSCTHCRRMKRDVFTQQSVADAMEAQGLVPVRIDTSTPDGQPIARQYQVRYLPTFVITDADGTVIRHTMGYKPTDDFLAFMQAPIASR